MSDKPDSKHGGGGGVENTCDHGVCPGHCLRARRTFCKLVWNVEVMANKQNLALPCYKITRATNRPACVGAWPLSSANCKRARNNVKV